MRIGVKRLLSCIEEVIYHMEEYVPLGRGASGDRGEQGHTFMPILCFVQQIEFWCIGKPKQD